MSVPDRPSGPLRRPQIRIVVAVAAALAAALSPTLVELTRHWVAEPVPRYALLFPLLLVRAAMREAPARPARTGYLLLAAGLALELVAMGGGMPKLARPGVPLAVVGLCRALGLASWSTSLLALWILPVPLAVCSLVSPLERLWFGAAAAVVGGGLALEPAREATLHVVGAAGTLAVRPWDGGVPLAVLAAGLGWYAALLARAEGGRPRFLRRAGGAALVGLALQGPVALLAVALLAAGHAGAAQAVQHHAIWALAAGGLVWAEASGRRAAAANARPSVPAERLSSRWEGA